MPSTPPGPRFGAGRTTAAAAPSGLGAVPPVGALASDPLAMAKDGTERASRLAEAAAERADLLVEAGAAGAGRPAGPAPRRPGR